MKGLLLTACVVGGLVHPLAAHAQETGDSPAPVAREVPLEPRGQRYTPADFSRFAPKNALDILNQVPGFTIVSTDQGRGLGEANTNVLINGERVALKSETIQSRLQKISVDKVVRVDIVDGATLKIPGLSGQVANIITRAGGITGQFEWDTRFRPGYVRPEWLGGDVSVSGSIKSLEYTLAVSNNGGRGSVKGPTVITDANGVQVEHRETHQANTSDNPKLSAALKWSGPGGSVAHLNATYAWNIFDSTSSEERSVPAGYDGHDYYPFDDDLGGGTRHRNYTPHERDHNYEIGGDFEFHLGPGRLKLIGLDRYDWDHYREDVVFTYVNGQPRTGGRYSSVNVTREKIARAEYNWRILGGDWQVSGEAAFNRYDGAARLFDLDPAGTFAEVPFPSGTGGVTEDRYESILTHSRQLGPHLSFHASVGGEYSKLAQTGSQGLTRTFWRPKGSASLAWQPRKGLDISLKLARVVGQLSFGDFLARVDLGQANGSAGNVNLVPPQSWELNLEAKKDLRAWGTTTVKLYDKRYQGYIDFIPLPGGTESRGNISGAEIYGVEWVSTFKLDPLGWKGAKIDADIAIETTRIRDPLTGQVHQWSNEGDRVANVTFRDDLPHSDWAWGASVQYTRVQPYYRMYEVGISYEGPAYTSAFIENKNVLGLDVRAQVFNLTNGRHIFRRTVYDAFRNVGNVIYNEDADQSVGLIYSLAVKGKF